MTGNVWQRRRGRGPMGWKGNLLFGVVFPLAMLLVFAILAAIILGTGKLLGL